MFYAILLAAPLEWWLREVPAGRWQIAGALLLLAGIVGYRRAGRVLGDQLSPLIAPREPATLVDSGPYTRVRHPMYRAELAMALGAPLTLGALVTLALSAVFAAVVAHRIGVEEDAVAARLPRYREYAARTKRLIPHVY